MFKFYSSSQIRAIRRDLPLKSCMKIRSCQGILVHHGGVLFEATHQRPHMVLDTQDNPPPKATLSVYS